MDPAVHDKIMDLRKELSKVSGQYHDCKTLLKASKGTQASLTNRVGELAVLLENAEAEIEQLKEDYRELEYGKGSSITGQQADKLRAEIKELTDLVILYQGEGEDEIPEEAEWRKLAEKGKKRTPEETKRVSKLAKVIWQQCNATWLRTEVARLDLERDDAWKQHQKLEWENDQLKISKAQENEKLKSDILAITGRCDILTKENKALTQQCKDNYDEMDRVRKIAFDQVKEIEEKLEKLRKEK